jgi:hypothetical protein
MACIGRFKCRKKGSFDHVTTRRSNKIGVERQASNLRIPNICTLLYIIIEYNIFAICINNQTINFQNSTYSVKYICVFKSKARMKCHACKTDFKTIVFYHYFSNGNFIIH